MVLACGVRFLAPNREVKKENYKCGNTPRACHWTRLGAFAKRKMGRFRDRAAISMSTPCRRMRGERPTIALRSYAAVTDWIEFEDEGPLVEVARGDRRH